MNQWLKPHSLWNGWWPSIRAPYLSVKMVTRLAPLRVPPYWAHDSEGRGAGLKNHSLLSTPIPDKGWDLQGGDISSLGSMRKHVEYSSSVLAGLVWWASPERHCADPKFDSADSHLAGLGGAWDSAFLIHSQGMGCCWSRDLGLDSKS